MTPKFNKDHNPLLRKRLMRPDGSFFCICF
ncbi:hypothetical protein V6Z12_A08G103500 [Gossypium hirsutum]